MAVAVGTPGLGSLWGAFMWPPETAGGVVAAGVLSFCMMAGVVAYFYWRLHECQEEHKNKLADLAVKANALEAARSLADEAHAKAVVLCPTLVVMLFQKLASMGVFRNCAEDVRLAVGKMQSSTATYADLISARFFISKASSQPPTWDLAPGSLRFLYDALDDLLNPNV